jgi:DNA-directed RNA polymerase specialized sigma24 family protein
MRDFGKLLERHYGWLRGRARLRARQYQGYRALQGDVDTLAEDLAQETAAIALGRAACWFQGETQNEDARTKALLTEALRSAITKLAGGKIGADTKLAGGEEEEARWQDVAQDSSDRDERFEHERQVVEAVRLAREHLNPNLRLTLLSIRFPDHLREVDVQDAKAFRKGGAKPVVRCPDEAWALYQQAVTDQRLLARGAAWKRRVAEIFRCSGPLGHASTGKLQAIVNNIDVSLSRAEDVLHFHGSETGGDTGEQVAGMGKRA